MSTDDIDLLAILRASQALSSETSPGRLRARLGEVLRAMTGATGVLMAERADGTDDWLVFDTRARPGTPSRCPTQRRCCRCPRCGTPSAPANHC